MTIKDDAEKLARDAGMQFDPRYMHWIAARGKFEGEQWYAPYFYDAWMNGDGEDCDGPCDEDGDVAPGTLFRVDGEESDAFDLECGHWVLLREDSQGFVLVTVHESRAAAEAKYRAWIGA